MAESADVPEDHRVRVARHKRERMRAHLLHSVMAVCSGEMGTEPKVIDDVVRHAEVSRGAFYKYFGSLEEAIAELGAALAATMTEDISSLYDHLEDPRDRTAMGFQLYLHRANLDRHWGGFLAHIGLLDTDNEMIRLMAADIGIGIRRDLYALPSIEAGLDLLVGTKIQAIKRLMRQQEDDAYISGMAVAVLRGFGRPGPEAAETVSRAEAALKAAGAASADFWTGPHQARVPVTQGRDRRG